MNYLSETAAAEESLATAVLSSPQCAAPQRFQKESESFVLLRRLTGKNLNQISANKGRTLRLQNLDMAATQTVLVYLRIS